MYTEADIRLEIDESLKNKSWKLIGSDKNVFTEVSIKNVGKADYVLKPKNRENPIIIIEAKRKGVDLKSALEQAKKYALSCNAPILYASDGSITKTLHLKNNKPLLLNGEEVDEFLDETMALKYLDNNEYNTIDRYVIQSRHELINIFSSSNKELRKEGLQAGIERFSEFCNILFLKLFSEQECLREEMGESLRINKNYRWDYFKEKDGDELLSYVNDTVLKHFKNEYGHDIFNTLTIKNPKTLKRLIDKLDPLSLIDINSDIKGDAFEHFLKSYLSNQHKDLGEYFTPRHIVKTLVKIANPKFGEKIYDPFCGTGGILIESFRHVYNKMDRVNLDTLRKEMIYGSEITSNARITKMNMVLTGDGHNNIKKIDSLKNPIHNKFDLVITNMPFSLGNYSEYASLYNLGSANGNSLCVEHCFNSINKNSKDPRIAMIIPDGILFDSKFNKLREYIYKNSNVENIVSLPIGAFSPYASDAKASIIYLRNIGRNVKQEKVWFFDVKNDGYTKNAKRERKEGDSDLDIFLSYNNTNNNSLELGFNTLDIQKLERNNYISIPNFYTIFNVKSSNEIIFMGDIIEELSIKNNDSIYPVWSVTNDEGFIVPRFKEQVASKNIEAYNVIKKEFFAYNPSRINVGSIAFNDKDEIGCVSPMYEVFKVKNKKVIPKYLYIVFKTKRMIDMINHYSFGGVRQTLDKSLFYKIPVVVPSIEIQYNIIDDYMKKKEKIDIEFEKIKKEKNKFEIEMSNNIWD